MIENAFYFILKALFILQIFKFLSSIFWSCRKRFDEKAKVNFRIYEWETNSYNTHIAQYLKKERQSDNEIWSVNRI